MKMWVKVLHSICNMGTRGLPNMYTLSPRACGPRASGCTYQADHPCPCYKYQIITFVKPSTSLSILIGNSTTDIVSKIVII